MNCERYRRYIIDLLSGEIKEREKEELLRHMESCGGCRRNYEETGRVMEASRGLASPVFDEDFWQKRLSELGTYGKPQRFALKPAIAAACLLAIFTFIFFRTPSTEHESVSVERRGGSMVLNSMPISEERLLEMTDYLDEKSASYVLDLIFENEYRVPFH